MASANHDLRERFFLSTAACIRHLPNFRGKVRALLLLHKLLNLERKHLSITTDLRRPIRYRARLDLFCVPARMAFCMAQYEPGTVEFLLRLWQPAEAFIDVGANIGLVAIPFTLLSRERQRAVGTLNPCPVLTYCIEPVASNQKALETNVELNRIQDSIAVISSAVGDREKDVDIQVEKNLRPGEGTGTANILPENSGYACERIALHVTTIDRLIDGGELPKRGVIIKIDTDGYDLFVLMGAKRLLEEGRPIIFGEFHAHCMKWHGQTIDDVQAFLLPFGYHVYVRGKGWSFSLRKKGEPYVQDALCVPAEKLERLNWCIGSHAV